MHIGRSLLAKRRKLSHRHSSVVAAPLRNETILIVPIRNDDRNRRKAVNDFPSERSKEHLTALGPATMRVLVHTGERKFCRIIASARSNG